MGIARFVQACVRKRASSVGTQHQFAVFAIDLGLSGDCIHPELTKPPRFTSNIAANVRQGPTAQ